MQKRTLTVLLFGVLGLSLCTARQYRAGTWRNFTGMNSVRSVAYSSGNLVAATGGGLFIRNAATGTFARWTNSENLSTNDLTALFVDASNRLWIGSSSGNVDVFDQSAGIWQSIADIAGSSRPRKTIHQFFGKGDSVYIVSDFGVSVFVISRWEFGDTYASFGFPTQAAVSSAAVTSTQVFVGTDQGLAVGSLSSPNLSSPTSWTTYGAPQGLATGAVNCLGVFHDTLLIGTSIGLYYFAGDTVRMVASTGGMSVVGITTVPSGIKILASNAGVYSVASAGSLAAPFQNVGILTTGQGTSLAVDPGTSTVAVGTADDGAAVWDGSTWTYTAPNGPQSNLFISLAVTPDGVLWAGTGIDGGGRGFYRYDASMVEGKQWKDFTVANWPLLGSNDYYKVSVGADGSVWLSSWGYGVIKVVADTVQRKINGRSQPSFAPTIAPTLPTDPIWVVIGNAVVDGAGKTWFDNYWATNGNYLATLTNDTTFAYTRCTAISCNGTFTSMVIDQNGTKWIANSEPTKKYPTGLYFYNENLSVLGTENTAGWGLIRTSEGLPNDIVLSLAVDQDNSVWVGTDLGVVIITNPQDPFNSMISSFPLREQSIQAIAVDGLNNKWIGTKEGVFVVNSDGTQLLNQYTVLNTNGKLVDNDVRSIAIDQRRGIAYFGTQNGLSSLQIPAVQPKQSFTKLEFGPNPFTLPNADPLIISNLVANSTVKILSVNGTVVAEFPAQGGGRAFWDGKDRQGRYVASGVYFVVAFADNGNQVSNGKIAVIRK